MKGQLTSFFFGGLLPILAFTLIEENYGPIWGTVAGMAFGFGEIIFEIVKYKKVSTMTWIGNGMILSLGAISIISQDGIWFKLQPALFEAFFAIFLWGSLVLKKNFLVLMAEKQGQQIPEILKEKFNGITFRVGIFFAIQAGLATWAAFSWSTEAWAFLKGIGLTLSFVVYLVAEGFYLRRQILKQKKLQKEL
ncbi:MAG: putative intracellular septation protein A [Oligoflexia bacterium]|nr:MAG: putative intracellular septation protein A [Oligoflexia bacterium]